MANTVLHRSQYRGGALERAILQLLGKAAKKRGHVGACEPHRVSSAPGEAKLHEAKIIIVDECDEAAALERDDEALSCLARDA